MGGVVSGWRGLCPGRRCLYLSGWGLCLVGGVCHRVRGSVSDWVGLCLSGWGLYLSGWGLFLVGGVCVRVGGVYNLICSHPATRLQEVKLSQGQSNLWSCFIQNVHLLLDLLDEGAGV